MTGSLVSFSYVVIFCFQVNYINDDIGAFGQFDWEMILLVVLIFMTVLIGFSYKEDQKLQDKTTKN